MVSLTNMTTWVIALLIEGHHMHQDSHDNKTLQHGIAHTLTVISDTGMALQVPADCLPLPRVCIASALLLAVTTSQMAYNPTRSLGTP